MEWFVWTLLGTAIAAAIDWDATPVGLVLGFIIGLIRQGASNRRRDADLKRDQRLQRLEGEVARLRDALAHLQPAATQPTPVASAATAGETATPPTATAPRPATHLQPELPDLAELALAPVADTAPGLMADSEEHSRGPQDDTPPAPATVDLFERARQWLFGGNTMVRLGILVLFFGLAFLAKFAADHALLPVELRLSAVAFGGIALLAAGWRLRQRREIYAMTLQGGGVAVLYLTVFTTLRIFRLMPPELAFALLLAIVVLAALLALLQNAPTLAVIGTAGGFAAPIIASTGSGDHVSLFAYYALLNAGVLFIARHKAWRILNLEAFVFTFVIGLAWGGRYYQPEFLETTEPFLILFWLMFVATAVLYARVQAPSLRHYVDGSLVFGVPVCGFGMQAALVHDIPFALAYSAMLVGGFYLLLARALWRRERLGLLAEAFLALGIAFLTLAIPLALDGRWTAAAWALEGAALVWVGIRQQRRLASVAGLLLQLAAGIAFLQGGGDHHRAGMLPFLNGAGIGSALIAIGALFSGAFCARAQTFWPRLQQAQWLMLVWGSLWWLGGGINELDWALRPREFIGALLLFCALSALAAWLAHRRSGWHALGLAAYLPLPAMALAWLQAASLNIAPLHAWGLVGWPLAVAVHLHTLRKTPDDACAANLRGPWLAVSLWVLALALGSEAFVRIHGWQEQLSAWSHAAFALPALLLVLAAPRLLALPRWPFEPWRDVLATVGTTPLAAALLLWTVLVNSVSNGNAAPLPYIPLLNPLDLTIIGALMSAGLWLMRLDASSPHFARVRALGWPLLGAAAFLATNGALLRAMHHGFAIPYRMTRLLAADEVQAALALFWSVLALLLMLTASRRALRTLWIIGAALMGVTVVKLFLVDMASSGTIARIVAFIGAGVLLLVVGYFSPLPPRKLKES